MLYVRHIAEFKTEMNAINVPKKIIDKKEVIHALRILKNSKAAGVDIVTAELLKMDVGVSKVVVQFVSYV